MQNSASLLCTNLSELDVEKSALEIIYKRLLEKLLQKQAFKFIYLMFNLQHQAYFTFQ